MGGFAKLKDDFERWFPTLDLNNIWTEKKPPEKKEQDAFRHLYLRCLFEIAGNLDTIALMSRASFEALDKMRLAEEARDARESERVQKLAEVVEQAALLGKEPKKPAGKKNAGA